MDFFFPNLSVTPICFGGRSYPRLTVFVINLSAIALKKPSANGSCASSKRKGAPPRTCIRSAPLFVLFDRRRRPGIPSDGGGYSPEEFEAVLLFDMVVVVLVLVFCRRRRRRPKDAQQILRRRFFRSRPSSSGRSSSSFFFFRNSFFLLLHFVICLCVLVVGR